MSRRVRTVTMILLAWMLIIVLRLVYLQVYQYDWMVERARSQQQKVVETGLVRGLIVDRAGIELARSIDTESFFAVPDEIIDIEATSKRLGVILGQDAKEISARLRNAKNDSRKFLWIARQVEADKAVAINRMKLAGIYSRDELKRYYPNGSLAAHVLGFVGTDDVGLAGVERVYNDKLNGRAGEIYLDTDGMRRTYGSTYGSIDASGNSGKIVVLTVDQTVQHWTEQALAGALKQTHAKSATAIVLDPRTGEILALANAPTFDPNLAHAINPRERVNNALQNIYEPGSTLKIIAYSAAIEEKIARPDELINCQMGQINVNGRIVHDHKPFGILSVTEALAKSSNVAAIKLGLRVGDARMYAYLTRFGFGSRTGIELPGETSGLLRPLARWSRTSIGSIAIGQEIGVTPLQMVTAFGSLTNDG
ncbi:MAG: peptidoglycan D,D-transpeptidase FtsI family protein, partial [Pyrinomonadaceae bacterium]